MCKCYFCKQCPNFPTVSYILCKLGKKIHFLVYHRPRKKWPFCTNRNTLGICFVTSLVKDLKIQFILLVPDFDALSLRIVKIFPKPSACECASRDDYFQCRIIRFIYDIKSINDWTLRKNSLRSNLIDTPAFYADQKGSETTICDT